MRALVTGAGGFVGRRLVPYLSAKGWEVSAIDIEVDVVDGEAVSAAVEAARPDAILHLAALSSVVATLDDPASAFRVNFLGTRNVLHASLESAPNCRVLFVGSGSTYGTSEPGSPAFREDALLRSESPYARTKAAGDLLARCYGERGLRVIRARPFNHTGRGRPDHFVESSIARQIAEIEAGLRPPRIEVGNLDSVRDFLHADDVVAAYFRLLDPAVPPGAYNVASGVGRRIGDVLETLLGLAGMTQRIEVVVGDRLFRPTDRAVGDASRLRGATGWSPERDFRSTLSELLDGWREVVR
jgi:GDP-4-dehydro-6-deoxy-D-mannose reductase